MRVFYSSRAEIPSSAASRHLLPGGEGKSCRFLLAGLESVVPIHRQIIDVWRGLRILAGPRYCVNAIRRRESIESPFIRKSAKAPAIHGYTREPCRGVGRLTGERIALEWCDSDAARAKRLLAGPTAIFGWIDRAFPRSAAGVKERRGPTLGPP